MSTKSANRPFLAYVSFSNEAENNVLNAKSMDPDTRNIGGKRKRNGKPENSATRSAWKSWLEEKRLARLKMKTWRRRLVYGG